MGYLAHLGWTCHAVNLRGHVETEVPVSIGRVRFADYLDDVRCGVAACDAPPVVIGHDLGGLLALHCAAGARAVVALAPMVPAPLAKHGARAFSSLGARLALWRSRPLPAPRGQLGADFFGAGAPGRTVLDSAVVARELRRGDLRFSINNDVPQLVAVGEIDRICHAHDAERLADYAGATFRRWEGAGHALPWEPGWERRVSEIHRWLVQRLGEPLLASLEDDGD